MPTTIAVGMRLRDLQWIIRAAGGDPGVVSNTKTFTQPGHGLAVGNAVYFNGSAWVKARADAVATLAEGLVDAVDGDDITIYIPGGHFWTVTSHGFGSAGATLWLSVSVAGAMQTSLPGSGFRQVMGQIIDTDTVTIQSFGADIAA